MRLPVKAACRHAEAWCRFKSTRVKMCPAAKRLRRVLADAMHSAGEMTAAQIAGYCGSANYQSITRRRRGV